MKHLLIDYENIQPVDFSWIDGENYHVWLFLGVRQQKLPFSLLESLLDIPRNQVHLVKMKQAGKNSLDFCLSFYIGMITATYPNAVIEILSDDSGYDILLRHLQANLTSISVSRLSKEAVIKAELPQQCTTLGANLTKGEEAYKQAKKLISSLEEQYRPRNLNSLKNYLRSRLRIDDANIVNIVVENLVVEKVFTVTKPSGSIAYKDSSKKTKNLKNLKQNQPNKKIGSSHE